MSLQYFQIKKMKDYSKLRKKYLNKKFNFVNIDGKDMHMDDDIFTIFKKQLKFPDYFGENWNAFYDCLKDLEWLKMKNTVIFIRNLKELANKSFFETFIDVLIDTSNFWKKEKINFDLVILLERKDKLLEKILNQIKEIEVKAQLRYKDIPNYFGV